MTTPVKFWFDASCPFAWATSRWIKEVEKVRDITVEFEPMSLSVLNDGRDLDPEYMEMMEANWGPARVFAKVKTEQPEKVDELYTAMGTLIHAKGNGGKKGDGGYDEIIAQALEQVGLPADFAEVARTEEYDEKLREYHHNGISSVGDEVGTPVIKLGDTAFFGPVITRVPTGEEAGELFDASVRLAQFPYFFELKRSRTEMPQVEED
ncbi:MULTISPECIES: disulfide bond formation protein DsbA [Corynebacterium]|jgi:dsbA oxidoreductase|uniref:mycothiol-dependent nitroreductase Rv2466c family protein n=1 Tax=Corynebacterium TaxID=1716 RepID=UPI001EF3F017|nr:MULTISPECIES: disulfide bond formation protein DsbA [Corynebacterium]MCG7242747.1 disulfide bond formation protein DsbA [Corynebacterium sp. ACRPS]MDK8473388.1 disulfide bond formation protein DsbA [Corynebacterium sp. MSK078]MDK8658685.1 disulfide bond formation protein DsbA [Corynebacterium sp. MSK204]MDK8814379.1 disulfide bond formation protein DsbA [Corynebacterium sp. MSK073]WKS60876.1 disulfide bond formation protein DsbA [Corynebacterium accolens]